MRYPPDERITFESELLPDHFPNPNITIPKDKVKSFNESYKELGRWAAEVCGTTIEKLCASHLISYLGIRNRLKEEHEELKKDLLWALENHGQFEWSNGIKARYVDRWFPELKSKLYIHQGGSRGKE